MTRLGVAAILTEAGGVAVTASAPDPERLGDLSAFDLILADLYLADDEPCIATVPRLALTNRVLVPDQVSTFHFTSSGPRWVRLARSRHRTRVPAQPVVRFIHPDGVAGQCDRTARYRSWCLRSKCPGCAASAPEVSKPLKRKRA